MCKTKVRSAVETTIANVFAWSMKCSSSGVAPVTGFYDEEFKKTSYRYGMKGQTLALGWRCLGYNFTAYNL